MTTQWYISEGCEFYRVNRMHIKMNAGVPEVHDRSKYWSPKPWDRIVQQPETMSFSFNKIASPITIGAYGYEIQVFGGHYMGTGFSPPGVKKVYLTIKQIFDGEVDEWMETNLPYFVAYNRHERVDKSVERRWIDQHATGLWALTAIDGGVRFAVENDAFWFKMVRT